LKDVAFVAFTLVGMLALMVYQQQYSTLAVYMRDVHGINSQGFGAILSITGLEVVVFQFWISRAINRRPAFLMMALSTLVFAIGFFMYGVVSSFTLFAVAAVIVCLGEMLFFPTSSALAASFAPEDMRGRYMAVSGWCGHPATVILPPRNYHGQLQPNLVWYVAGFCVSGIGYYALHLKLGNQHRFAPPPLEVEVEAAA
jgi:MFS family permease